jgi:hypothetical protein
MTIHDTGPGTETDYPEERNIVWGHDGAHGDGELERPFIDDEPPEGHGWNTRSRWGSRPAMDDVVRGVWTRLRDVFASRQRLIPMSLFLTTAVAIATAAAGQAAPVGDDAIRRGVERALSDLDTGDNGDIRVRVADGVVWLTGSVPTWQGTAARLHATRSVTGVRSIMNELRLVVNAR